MSSSHAQLRSVQTDCPSIPGPPPYPTSCHFTAFDTGEKLTPGELKERLGPLLAGPHQVSGTVEIQGVYTRTMTYVYVINYGPCGERIIGPPVCKLR